MINKLLTARKLPPLGERSAMTEKLLDGEYGRMPPKPDCIRYSVTENFIPAFCAGKAVSTKVDITVGMGGDEFTFPIYVSVPSRSGKHPFFVCINFPYWFCGNYQKYGGNEGELPFDQHRLMASIAPRYVYIASAKQDLWADPDSEFLSCAAASGAYEKMGLSGFVHADRLPIVGDEFHGGHIGYHMRDGMHYFSREDWQKVIKFVNRQMKIESGR